MRSLISISWAVLWCIVVTSPASAGESVSGGGQGGGDHVNITGRYMSESNSIGGTSNVEVGTGPPVCYATYKDYSGQIRSIQGECGNIPDAIDFAPLAPLDPVEPAAAQRQAIVREYIRDLVMPRPQPKMSAIEGISGARHSLDLQTSAVRHFPREDTSFGRMTATAHGSFVVDWGDGTKTSHTSGGAPWPNTDVSHTYEKSGTYDITVVARWSVDWSLGMYSGVVGGLQTTGTINDWVVVEAQAVLVR